MNNIEFIKENLDLMEKQLRYTLRMVNNLQTIVNEQSITIEKTIDEPIDPEITKIDQQENQEQVNELLTLDKEYCKQVAQDIINTYFHSDTVNKGIGKISLDGTFKLYFGKLLMHSVDTLMEYPDGFYTVNDETGLDFLFKCDDLTIIIDGLETTPTFYYINKETKELIPFTKDTFESNMERIGKQLASY